MTADRTPLEGRTLRIKQPQFPQFEFHWHPGVKKLFLIRTTAAKPEAEVVAENVDSSGYAHNMALMFLRGYREGRTPTLGETVPIPQREDAGARPRQIDQEIAALQTERRTIVGG